MKNSLALDISSLDLEAKNKTAMVMRRIVELQNKRYKESNAANQITAYRVSSYSAYNVYGIGWG